MGNFPHGKFRLLSLGKASWTVSRYPTYGACWVFWCVRNPPSSDMDYRVLNVRTDVNACDCTQGCTDTVRESAPKVDWEKKKKVKVNVTID